MGQLIWMQGALRRTPTAPVPVGQGVTDPCCQHQTPEQSPGSTKRHHFPPEGCSSRIAAPHIPSCQQEYLCISPKATQMSLCRDAVVASLHEPSQGCPPKGQQGTSAVCISAHPKPSSQRLLSCLAVIFSQQNARQNQDFLLQEKGSHSWDRREELMGLGTVLRLKSSSSRPYSAVTCTKIWLFPFSCQMERKRKPSRSEERKAFTRGSSETI